MYGTVATMHVKPGLDAKLTEVSEKWWQERAPQAKGVMSSTVFKKDGSANEYIIVAVFDSKANYEANAEDPAQNAWYQEMRACLEADPDWADGEVVFARHQH